jgi:hypothetical protein
MAALEEEAKPILIRQMSDRHDRLTPPERDVLVRWLAKTTAVYEMDDPISAVLPAEVRAGIAQEGWRPKGLWEFDAVWISLYKAHVLAHGRAMLMRRKTGELLAESMIQCLWLGHAGYLVQYRTGIEVTQRRLPVGRMPLWPRLSPDGPRPMVSESKWWDVLEGEYN